MLLIIYPYLFECTGHMFSYAELAKLRRICRAFRAHIAPLNRPVAVPQPLLKFMRKFMDNDTAILSVTEPFMNEDGGWDVQCVRVNGAQGFCARKPEMKAASMRIGPTGRTVQIERRSAKNNVVITLSKIREFGYMAFDSHTGRSTFIPMGFKGLATYTNLLTGVHLSLRFDVSSHTPQGMLNELNITDPSFRTIPTAAEVMDLIGRFWP